MIVFHIFISTVSLVDMRSRQYMTQALIQIQRDDVEHMPCVQRHHANNLF